MAWGRLPQVFQSIRAKIISASTIKVGSLTGGVDVVADIDGLTITNDPASSAFVAGSTGAGVNRKFRVGEVGGWVALQTQTAAASASLNFVLPVADFEDFQFVIHHLLPTTDNVHLYIRTDGNGGASFDAGVSDYRWWTEWTSTGVGTSNDNDAADAQISVTGNLAANGISNVANEGISGFAFVINSNASAHCTIKYEGFYIAADADDNVVKGWGRRVSATAVDAVQFLMSSGTIASGTITMMGRRKVT